MAKQVKSVGDSDRISSLADPILCHILSFLPTEEAVRTSILSRRWRYLFASMSTLDFCDSLAYSKYDNFKNFVDRLLYHPNQVSVECFRMCDISVIDYGDELRVYDDLRLYGWICVVLQRGVKVIDICSELSPVLPIHLFTCQSLVSLKLDLIGELKVPNKVCLPNLKTLHLRYLEFSDGGSMHWLISSCLVLEELIMEHVEFPADIRELNIHNLFLKRFVLCSGEMNKSVYRDFNYDVVINAPNLLYFRYADLVSDSYSLSPMNSLEQADIRVYQYYLKYDADHEFGVSNLLQATCNVKSLYLVIDEAETLIPMCLEPVVTFHKLVELEFVNECEDWQGTWLIEFLNCVPNLNTLHLTLEPPTEGIKPLPEKVPSCLSFHLKEIKFSKFDGETHLFEMISYFLEHATFLEKLMIEMKSLEGEEQSRITNKLLTIPRNSKQCQVVIL